MLVGHLRKGSASVNCTTPNTMSMVFLIPIGIALPTMKAGATGNEKSETATRGRLRDNERYQRYDQ